jgi:hypothetical protein
MGGEMKRTICVLGVILFLGCNNPSGNVDKLPNDAAKQIDNTGSSNQEIAPQTDPMPRVGKITIDESLLYPHTSDILPRQLAEICVANGWKQVSDFYGEYRQWIEPPYVIFSDASGMETAAFWCEGPGYNQWFLNFYPVDNGGVIDGCPSTIPWKNHPDGLSFWNR